MGRKAVDITGQRFGKLTAISRSYEPLPSGKKVSKWFCACDCGKQKKVGLSELLGGNTSSCGCIKNTRNGLSIHPLYKTWTSMIARCSDPASKDYPNYGGRGIQVCARWLSSFETFLSDMGSRPNKHTLERNDNDGNYSPENCYWANAVTQTRNQRTSRLNRFDDSDFDAMHGLAKQGKLFREIADLFDTNADFVSGVCAVKSNGPMPWSLGFSAVSLVPKMNICTSRLEVDISSEVLKGVRLDIPLIAANMSTVCNSSFCIELSKLGALGILHRAAPNEILISETQKIAKACDLVAVSIGIGSDQESLADDLIRSGANIITIDIANGYSQGAIDMARHLKTKYPNVKIILGNTTHVGLLVDSADFVDAVKVGIAQGFACETANTAAHTERQFSAVYKFKSLSKKLGIPVISDGGIREPGDFVKAIAAGANSVMAGMIFARCPESAAETFTNDDGKIKKIYAGMASRHVQNKWKGGIKKGTCPEGKTTVIDIGENLEALLERYSGALRTGITYGGAKEVTGFQAKAEFIRLA